MAIKEIILSHKLLYELYFFITQKKVYKKRIDKKIHKLEVKDNNFIPKLVVSLTSFGERINELQYTLYSLLVQSIKPEKIIVWLAIGEKIPEHIEKFKKYGIEFEFCEDIKSYKKLIPSIKKYPDYYIVTADDDIFYPKNWLLKIWTKHKEFPDAKITHIAHRVVLNENNEFLPYKEWKHNVKKSEGILFPTGGGGTLYNASRIHKDFCDSTLFMKLAPYADDVWFYFMGVLMKQEVIIVDKPNNRLKYVDIYKEYGLNNKYSLQLDNVENNQNDIQIKNIMDYYQLSINDII